MIYSRKYCWCLLLLLVFLAGCAEKRIPVTINEQVFYVEIADTAEERRVGLMYREALEADRGMLFVFPEEEPRSFWMKNTLIPLDLAFISTGGRILSIRRGIPLNLDPIPSGAPAQYVLEVNAGQLEERGIEVGDSVSFRLPD